MLVRIYSLLAVMVFFLITTGCAKQAKEEAAVFPENSASCQMTAHKNRYLAKKSDGTIVEVYADSREELLENFVRPNLEILDYVESDQIILANEFLVSRNSDEQSPSALETWGPERIQANAAWNQNIKGQGVIVAVIDSGVNIQHNALSSKIYVNQAEKNGFPGFDDDGNGFVDDINGWDFSRESPYNNDTSGHGTHVAGVISGSHNSVIRGVAPDSKILPLDFMDGGSGFTSDAIESIEYAKKMGARVINASWGSSFCSKLLNDSIDSLVEKNILFVAAAGNSGNDLSRYPEYPAAFVSSAQITVGAITRRGFMASFSNYGTPVDVMAPGDEILSAYLGQDYMYLSGTSMAAPFVSGLAALLIGQKPNITVTELKNIIMSSVISGNYPVKTRGEINVPQALSLLD